MIKSRHFLSSSSWCHIGYKRSCYSFWPKSGTTCWQLHLPPLSSLKAWVSKAFEHDMRLDQCICPLYHVCYIMQMTHMVALAAGKCIKIGPVHAHVGHFIKRQLHFPSSEITYPANLASENDHCTWTIIILFLSCLLVPFISSSSTKTREKGPRPGHL